MLMKMNTIHQTFYTDLNEKQNVQKQVTDSTKTILKKGIISLD